MLDARSARPAALPASFLRRAPLHVNLQQLRKTPPNNLASPGRRSASPGSRRKLLPPLMDLCATLPTPTRSFPFPPPFSHCVAFNPRNPPKFSAPRHRVRVSSAFFPWHRVTTNSASKPRTTLLSFFLTLRCIQTKS